MAGARADNTTVPLAGRIADRAVAVGITAAVLVPGMFLRPLDGDEGDYAAAAGLVAEGELLYHDFLYTQMPVLPYVYGVWGLLTGETWIALRALSVLCAAALGLLVYEHLRERLGRGWAVVGVTFVASASLFSSWFVTVKTYALSTLLLFAAFALVHRLPPLTPRIAFAGGALAALSVETRALLVGGAAALAWGASTRGRLGGFAFGFGVGLAPSLVFLLLDADRFLFGNLFYHGARSEGGLVGDFGQKFDVVANLLGIATQSRSRPQYFLLLLTAVAAGLTLRAMRRPIPHAFLVAAGLGLVALLPTPTYAQYFATTVPFLIVGIVEFAAYVQRRWNLPVTRAAGIVVLGAFLLFSFENIGRLFVSFRENRPLSVQEVNDAVATRVGDGDVVAASWAGYVYGTGARPLPGLENAFAPHEAAGISADDARKYHVASAADVERALRAGEAELVVVKVWHDLEPIPDYEGAARAGGYRLADVVNTVRLYARAG